MPAAAGMPQPLLPMAGSYQVNLLDLYGVDKMARTQGSKPSQLASSNYPAPVDVTHSAPQKAIYYGWWVNPQQVAGMSYLWVDTLNQMPVPAIPYVPRPPQIQRSYYEQTTHYRTWHPLYAGWRPVRDDSNTLLDVRIGAAPVKPQPTKDGGNLPGGVRMNPPLEHGMMLAAWRIPRFSTEPYTVVPQSTG